MQLKAQGRFLSPSNMGSSVTTPKPPALEGPLASHNVKMSDVSSGGFHVLSIHFPTATGGALMAILIIAIIAGAVIWYRGCVRRSQRRHTNQAGLLPTYQQAGSAAGATMVPNSMILEALTQLKPSRRAAFSERRIEDVTDNTRQPIYGTRPRPPQATEGRARSFEPVDII